MLIGVNQIKHMIISSNAVTIKRAETRKVTALCLKGPPPDPDVPARGSPGKLLPGHPEAVGVLLRVAA